MIRTAIRIFFVTAYAFLVFLVIRYTLPENVEIKLPEARLRLLFIYFFFFNLNIEGCMFFDRYLDKKIPWYFNITKRLFMQLGFVFGWSILTVVLPFMVWFIINGGSFIYPPTSIIVFLCSILFMLVFIAISMTGKIFKQRQDSLLEIEHLKQEKLKADYRVLQQQVNPHFLFNSLNVLISEIKHQPDNAVEFTRKLSKVYRYVLQSKNYELISLELELDFIESFIFLHKVRIGEALNFSLQISDEAKRKQLPPLTLQILIENAIKHNVANEENILVVSIRSTDSNILEVKNSLNLKTDAHSTNIGLSNIRSRYALLNKGEIKVEQTSAAFIVSVPLIDD